ncbi:MAG: carbamoyltransferase [Omnitrophica bacterium RIFCSPHIGHO2_02_FULL_46_11]|nr:MAG: carbamoyltransferase [Omnitrophica bacterium RIFCSPLOWO2_01_FULL_45_10b]OGW86001.1 MAG: carbamoyltransferase [Omnitrophica bacterium RIFCSPHIGHO2_02_FULL_46_11]
MMILGINAYHGDAAACLIKDGEIIAACEEERLRRIKHCAGFPILAIRSCLAQTGTKPESIDCVAISRDPKANLSKKILYAIKQSSKISNLIKSRFENAGRIINVKSELTRALSLSQPLQVKVHQTEHHLAHMASCFYPSPFDRAAILSIDGFGDFVSTKWGWGEGRELKSLGQVNFPHSAGILYTALTQYLGFPNYGDEYKVMALAAYGKPRYKNELKEMISLDSKNGFRLNLDFFVHHRNGVEMNWKDGYPNLSACYSRKFIEAFGPPRLPDEPLEPHHQDLAASLQKKFEDVYFHILNELHKKTQTENLCLAGGCAFNSVANGKIKDHTPFKHMFIQPAAGDAGTALGAGLYLYHSVLKNPRRFRMEHAYLGPQFEPQSVKRALDQANLQYQELNGEKLIPQVARSISEGKIVGWFQGRMEFGPRALGNRSLLADPRRKEMREWLNEKIKLREDFRPFAPSVPSEEVGIYFETEELDPFMTRVFKIKKEKQSLIPAVTHVDGTGRLQAVERKTNPKFWSLLQEFKKLTGVPVLLNTSFNENEPIVCTPEEAINCFVRSGMDALAIENFWVERKQN